MPSYRTRANKTAKKKARKYPKRLPRDPVKLLRWAARGTVQDYEKLRQLARKARDSLPAHVDRAAYDRLTHIDRLTMIEEIQAAEEHNISAGFFLDAVNWLFDKIPFGNWLWPVSATQSAINALKGDGLNEVDEQYARLVGATYGKVDTRPFVIDHWKRQVQFDSSYISVWDNPDGHRVITVRGTRGTGQDVGEDILVGLTGRTTDVIGRDLLQIIAATPDGMVIDLAAHSLGTSLALSAFGNKTIYNAIHETYMFNPAYSPFLKGLTDAYERDTNSTLSTRGTRSRWAAWGTGPRRTSCSGAAATRSAHTTSRSGKGPPRTRSRSTMPRRPPACTRTSKSGCRWTWIRPRPSNSRASSYSRIPS